MLSPNALRVLECLGIYEKLRTQGYNFEEIAFKNHDEITTDHYFLGDEKTYGYKALRIYRRILLDELRWRVHELGIPIHYGKRFDKVISESDNGVIFAFADGSTSSADLLVGTDGIHSTVRKYIAPAISPLYTGQVAVTCTIPRTTLKVPNSYPMPAAIHGPNGAFVMAPQNTDGSEILAGTQFKYPEQDRTGWNALVNNKKMLLELFRAGYDTWSPTVRTALDNVREETMAIWPYYVIPKLPQWASPSKRVIILGDAAHAIPPTAGQGASQGFEDSFTLATILTNISPDLPLDKAIDYWKNIRQERIDKVIALTLRLNNARLPEKEREQQAARGMTWDSGAGGTLSWLYNARIEEDLLKWITAGNAENLS
jgi:2-polyprenyl-6-methoxyphenol hydroxylase-like FAD-dependent oxidoreductase